MMRRVHSARRSERSSRRYATSSLRTDASAVPVGVGLGSDVPSDVVTVSSWVDPLEAVRELQASPRPLPPRSSDRR